MECDADHSVSRGTMDLERLVDEIQKEHRDPAAKALPAINARCDEEILADAALMLTEQREAQRQRWGFDVFGLHTGESE